MTVYSVGVPVNTHATAGSVTGTWGTQQFRVAGHLLVAVVTAGASTSVAATATVSGWTLLLEVPNSGTANVRVAYWTKVAAGSDAAPTFTSAVVGTGAMDCMLFEMSGANTATPIDVSASFASGAVGTVSCTATTAALAQNGELGLSCFAQNAAAGNLTFTDTGTGALFSKLLNGNGVSSVLQTYVGITGPPGSATLNDAGTFSTNTTAFGAGIVIAFAQVPVAPAVNVAFANNATATVTVGGTTAPAGGTPESWTVNVTSAFPVAAAGAQPPTQVTVCDPALPAEKFLVTTAPGGVGSSQSWTVTRGAEGTTPVSHTAGFTIVDITTAGFLTGVSQELSATAYVQCDYTGATDASAAFNTALASLPNVNGRAVGKIIFGPGNVRFTVTPNNPGPCVYIEGQGKWSTFINSFVTGGDCFRVFDSSAASANDNTTNGGGISQLTINGAGAGASSNGLHAGDLTNYFVDIIVLNFNGSGSKGVWFDNELYFTEMINGELYVSGCTQCVVFDNPSSGASTSTSSFARCNLVIKLGQGLNGSGQDFGDGVVLQNGAIMPDSDLSIIGNYTMSAASTSSAVLRVIGTVPAGHGNAGVAAGILFSRLHIGIELDPHGGNSFSPMTVFTDGNGRINGCYGQLDFGAASAFTASNMTLGAQFISNNVVVRGDPNLGAVFSIAPTEQFAAQASPYTLANNASAQPLFNVSASGALAVPAAYTYFFECAFVITSLSSSAHTVNFGFGGTATYTSVGYQALTATAAGGAMSSFQGVAATATAIMASATTTVLQCVIKGVIRVNAAGSLIPQVTQVTNTAAGVVAANSYFRLSQGYGSNTVTLAGFGNWS